MVRITLLILTAGMVGWTVSTESYALAAINAAAFLIVLNTKD